MRKNTIFAHFSCPDGEKSKRPLFGQFWSYVPIAHLEAFYPYFLGNISKLASPLKQWVRGHPEVRWSRFVSLKKPCFRHNFWTETLISPIFTTSTPPCHTWLESYGSHLQFGTELPRFEGSYQPSEFLWHVGTESRNVSLIWDLVISPIWAAECFSFHDYQFMDGFERVGNGC